MSEEIQYLDLHVNALQGWHLSRREDGTKDIRRYQELIREGSEAPPVHVCQIGPNAFTLDLYHTNPNRGRHEALLDGGHRRSRAYYEEAVPLPVIISKPAFAVPLEKRILIQDMYLVEQVH